MKNTISIHRNGSHFQKKYRFFFPFEIPATNNVSTYHQIQADQVKSITLEIDEDRSIFVTLSDSHFLEIPEFLLSDKQKEFWAYLQSSAIWSTKLN